MENINIYCDESCHLEHDHQPIMALGAIQCSTSLSRSFSEQMFSIMKRHNSLGELKWTKVSRSRMDFYIDLIDWFFKEDLNFRILIIPDKNKLNHEHFNNGSHDDFYYKMYFSLLNKIIDVNLESNIYIDIKDTKSNEKIIKLKNVLCNDKYDFTGGIIKSIQQVQSHQFRLLQLTDFFIGLACSNIKKTTSQSKKEIIGYLRKRLLENYNFDLDKSTPLHFKKFNLFYIKLRETCIYE